MTSCQSDIIDHELNESVQNNISLSIEERKSRIEDEMYEYEEYFFNMFEGNDDLMKECVKSEFFDPNFRYDYRDNRTPIMLCCDAMYYEGIKILLENGADLTLLDDNGDSALSILMNSYNTNMERIHEGCDSLFLVCVIESIRRGIENPIECMKYSSYWNSKYIHDYLRSILKHPLIDNINIFDVLKGLVFHPNNDLNIFDVYSPVTREEVCKIVEKIANSTYDGHFVEHDRILELLKEYGHDLNTVYPDGKSVLIQCFDNNHINFRDGRMHSLSSLDALFGVKFLIKQGVDTSGLIEHIEEQINSCENDYRLRELKEMKSAITKWINSEDLVDRCTFLYHYLLNREI